MRKLIFALGMLVLCSRAIAAPLTADEAISFLIDHIEGVTLVADDCGKGPSKFGINQTANPDVDVRHLSRAAAVSLYRARYWNSIGAGSLPNEFKFAAFDAAVNFGVDQARKMLALARGSVTTFVRLRFVTHARLLAQSPKLYTPYVKAWLRRDIIVATIAGVGPQSESNIVQLVYRDIH